MSIAFHPAGDCAVLVELEGEIGDALSMRLRGLEALVAETIPDVTETVPAFRTLLVEPSVPGSLALTLGELALITAVFSAAAAVALARRSRL